MLLQLSYREMLFQNYWFFKSRTWLVLVSCAPLHPYHPTNTGSIVVSEVFFIILYLLFFLSLLRLFIVATRRSYRAKCLTFGTVLNSPFTDIVWLADWEIQKDVREYCRKCHRSWHFVINLVVENCRISMLSFMRNYATD